MGAALPGARGFGARSLTGEKCKPKARRARGAIALQTRRAEAGERLRAESGTCKMRQGPGSALATIAISSRVELVGPSTMKRTTPLGSSRNTPGCVVRVARSKSP